MFQTIFPFFSSKSPQSPQKLTNHTPEWFGNHLSGNKDPAMELHCHSFHPSLEAQQNGSKHNLDLPPTGPLPCNGTLITSQLAWKSPHLSILFHPSIFQLNPPNLSQAGINPSISEISSCHPLDREGASPNLDASVRGSVFLQYPQDTKATKGTWIQSMEGIYWKHHLFFIFMKSNLTHPLYRTGNESTFTALITTKEWISSDMDQYIANESRKLQSTLGALL